MNHTSKRTMALAVIPAVLTFLLVQACGSSDDAVAQTVPPSAAPADPIVGLWESVVTARDCASGAALATFRGMNMLQLGGTVSDTNAAPTSTRGPGFGTWIRRAGGPEYVVTFRFFVYKPDGSFDGLQRVVRTVTLSADGNTANATSTTQRFDASGAQSASGCASDVSTRAT